MTRLLVALVTALLAWCGVVQPPKVAASTPKAVVVAYAYTSDDTSTEVLTDASERGPPAAYDRATTYDAATKVASAQRLRVTSYDSPSHVYGSASASVGGDSASVSRRGLPKALGAASVGASVSWSGFGVAAKSVRFGPMNPGPLADEVASTFRSSSYTMSELSEATTLYRVYGGKAGQLGSYWSRVKPSGPLQAQLDSALNPAWGNSATSVATIRVPSGTTIYEGAAASQPIGGGGSLLGGGSQVYIPRVDSSWLVP